MRTPKPVITSSRQRYSNTLKRAACDNHVMTHDNVDYTELEIMYAKQRTVGYILPARRLMDLPLTWRILKFRRTTSCIAIVKIKGKVFAVPVYYAIKTDEGTQIYFQALLISALHDSEWVALPPRPSTHLAPRVAGKRKIPAPTVNWNPVFLFYIPNFTDNFSHVDGNIILPIPRMISDHMAQERFLPRKTVFQKYFVATSLTTGFQYKFGYIQQMV